MTITSPYPPSPTKDFSKWRCVLPRTAEVMRSDLHFPSTGGGIPSPASPVSRLSIYSTSVAKGGLIVEKHGSC